MIVLKPEEMKKVDRAAIEAGFPDILLMETAGRGVAGLADRILKNAGKRVLVFAGKGNNGGDGLVAARFLDMWGYQVEIILLAGEKGLKGSPLVNYRLCRLREIDILEFSEDGDNNLKLVKNAIMQADLIIDAMLGTGLKGDVRQPVATMIDLINQSQKKVLAVDIPSGIDGEKGRVLGKAIRADFTATMAYPKLGLVVYPGKEYTGQLEVVDLGVPEEYTARTGCNHFLLTGEEAGQLLPERPVTGHKGTFGKVGILGGSRGMAGAPALTGLAALKTGAGLVRVAVPRDIQATVAARSPELITIGLAGIDDLAEIDELQKQSDIMAAGPGLGRSEAVRTLVDWLLRECELPLVLDADGLNAIQDLQVLKERQSPLILTPHPGEMARLLKEDIATIQRERISFARDFATTYQLYLVLKGAATLIALPDGRVYINPTGNEGMATAGSGDVLTGIISGLLAQGSGVEEAAILGPYLHGLAGDLAKEELGSNSMIAGDIINYLPPAIRRITNTRTDPGRI